MSKFRPALIPWFYFSLALGTGVLLGFSGRHFLIGIPISILIVLAILLRNPDLLFLLLFILIGYYRIQPEVRFRTLLEGKDEAKVHGKFRIYNESLLRVEGAGLFLRTSLPGFQQGSLVEIEGSYRKEFNAVLPSRVAFIKKSSSPFDIIHNRINLDLFQIFGSYEEGLLIKALLTGDRKGLSKKIVEDFRKAGAAHVLAISGLHIGFLFLFVSTFLMFLLRKRLFAEVLAVLVISIYALSLGPLAPCIRALIFIILVVLSSWTGRRILTANIWGISSVVTLIFRPSFIKDPSFLFSYLSVFSYIYVKDFLGMETKGPSIVRKIQGYVITVTAPLFFTFSLQARFFYRISFLGLISNLLFVPMVFLLIFEAFLALALFESGLSLWQPFRNCAVFITKNLLHLAELLGSLPGNSVEVQPTMLLFAFHLLSIILFTFFFLKSFKKVRSTEVYYEGLHRKGQQRN